MTDKFNSLKEWFQKPLGIAVLDEMQEPLALSLENLYCQNVLQLGVLKQELTCLTKRTVVTPYRNSEKDAVIANYEWLPFENNSFNLVFLPLILELYADIEMLIQEIDRILIAEGYILICGFNPGSLWGLAKLLQQQQLFPIPDIALRTSLSLRNLLVNQGYEICRIHSFFYRFPVNSAASLERYEFLENVGKMLWPYPGGIYLLLAQKKESKLMAIKPLWHFRRYVFGKEFAEPSIRGGTF